MAIENWCDAPEIHPSQIRVGDTIGTVAPDHLPYEVRMISTPQAGSTRWTFFGRDKHGQQHSETFRDGQLVRRYTKAS
jgi:hypothetical protein